MTTEWTNYDALGIAHDYRPPDLLERLATAIAPTPKNAAEAALKRRVQSMIDAAHRKAP